MDTFKTPLSPPKKKLAHDVKTPLKTIDNTKDDSALVTPKNHFTDKELKKLLSKNLLPQTGSCSTSKKTSKEITEDIQRIEPKKLVFASNVKFNPDRVTGLPIVRKRKLTVPKPFNLTGSARKPKP